MTRLKKHQVAEIVSEIFGSIAEPAGGNWIDVPITTTNARIYFSQCKPASPNSSHWKYDFFHTLQFFTLQDIGKESGILVLLNYIDCLYTILDTADLLWIAKYSSRNKKNEGIVCDIVIDRDSSGTYQLRPYDRHRSERRQVEIRKW